jgi:AcrR family transcriptional regulator
MTGGGRDESLERAPRRSDATRAAILRAARERFAADGYERATIRAIAADASIDPSMVMRYYGSKEALFAAAADFDLRLPDLAALPREQVGAAAAAHFLSRWESDGTMAALLRAGLTHPAGAERLRSIFADQLGPAVAALSAAGGGDDPIGPAQRAGLAATQVLGLALARYVLRLPPVVDMPREALVAWIGPTLQRYLVGSPEDPGAAA